MTLVACMCRCCQSRRQNENSAVLSEITAGYVEDMQAKLNIAVAALNYLVSEESGGPHDMWTAAMDALAEINNDKGNGGKAK